MPRLGLLGDKEESMPANVKDEKCTGCKLCIFSCPESNVISFKKKEKKVVIDPISCKDCGICVEICPLKAVAIVSGGSLMGRRRR